MPGLFICLFLQLHVDRAAERVVRVDGPGCCGGNIDGWGDGWRRVVDVRRRRFAGESRGGLALVLSSVVLIDQLAKGVCQCAAYFIVCKTLRSGLE